MNFEFMTLISMVRLLVDSPLVDFRSVNIQYFWCLRDSCSGGGA